MRDATGEPADRLELLGVAELLLEPLALLELGAQRGGALLDLAIELAVRLVGLGERPVERELAPGVTAAELEDPRARGSARRGR
jgi:hypothetical protein